MPTFRYDDPEPLVYHAHGLVEPGATVTADENPDEHRWVEVTPAKSSKSAPPAGEGE
jgi:hypothetical protein